MYPRRRKPRNFKCLGRRLLHLCSWSEPFVAFEGYTDITEDTINVSNTVSAKPEVLRTRMREAQEMNTNADDAELIRRVAARDKEAFEFLYKRYAPRVYRHLAERVRDKEMLEEMLDDVMLVVWQTASQYDSNCSIADWILAIAVKRERHVRLSTNGSGCIEVESDD
jgi:Sigma-70 region 2